MGDSLAAKRVHIAVLTFGGQVSTVGEFGTIKTVQPPLLIAKGNIPLGEAVERGLAPPRCTQGAIPTERHRILQAIGVSDHQRRDDGQWKGAACAVADAEHRKQVGQQVSTTPSPTSSTPSRAPIRARCCRSSTICAATPPRDLYLTGFYNRFHNLIFQDIRVIGGVEQNVVQFGGSRAYGLEFEGAVRPVDGVQLAVRGVVQNGKFKDFGTNTGNSVNRQPKFQIAAIPSYTFRSAWGKARVFGTFTHIGDRFADIENQQRLGSYETVDLGASLDLNDRFSLQATVENLTNKLALTEGNVRTVGSANTDGFFLGRPIFGRHATITAAYKF